MITPASSPLTVGSWFVSWRLDPVGILLALLLTVPYLVLWRRAASRGVRWPWWRTATYLVGGVGSLLYSTCGPIGVYRATFVFMFAAQVAVIGTVTPVGLAIGDPVRLAAAASGRDQRTGGAFLRSPAVRLLTHPAVAFLLDIGGIILVFFTGYGDAAARSTLIGTLLILQLLLVGSLFVVPMLTDGVLPSWATPGVRAVLALFDGLADAVPGILVMTAHSTLLPNFPGFNAAAGVRDGLSHTLDQKYAGGALLAVAEAVGIPMLAAVFVEWMRSDAADARAIDAELDARSRPTAPTTARASTTAATAQGRVAARDADAADSGDDGPGVDQPWWLSDPRFADRYSRGGD